MQSFLQFVIIGLGAGATYALFAQGAVLIYRGSGAGQLRPGCARHPGRLRGLRRAEGRAPREDPARLPGGDRRRGRGLAAVPAPGAAHPAQRGRHRAGHRHRRPAGPDPGARHQAVRRRQPRPSSSTCRTTCGGGATCSIQEERLYLVAISAARDGRRCGRGPATPAPASPSAPAPRTSGPSRRSAGRPTASPPSPGASAAPSPASPRVLVAPLTGLSGLTLTMVVTVAGLAAALLGGFQSFPLTFVGGLVVGLGEALATRYRGDVEGWLHQSQITGLNRAAGFLVILAGAGGQRAEPAAAVARRRPPAAAGHRQGERAGAAASAASCCSASCSPSSTSRGPRPPTSRWPPA